LTLAAQMERTITEKENTDPEFYKRFSEKISYILQKMREEKMADLQAFKEMKAIKDDIINKKDESIPGALSTRKGADIFYRNLNGMFEKHDVNDDAFVQIILDVYDILQNEGIVDWHKNSEVKRIMINKVDDYFYDVVKEEKGIDLSSEEIKSVIETTMGLAENNAEIF